MFSHARRPLDRSRSQPGDFDDDRAAIDPRGVQVVEAGSGGGLTLVVGVENEDAKHLERIAAERGKGVTRFVAEPVRKA